MNTKSCFILVADIQFPTLWWVAGLVKVFEDFWDLREHEETMIC